MDHEALEFLAELESKEEMVSPNDTVVPPGERECPICKQKMQIEVQEGIQFDVCEQHGMWFDRGELESVFKRFHAGHRIDRAKLVKQARRDGKISGTIFGAWSLLLN